MSESAGVKQVIVLRKDLNMRKGKMVAQGAHASIGAVLGAWAFSGHEPDGDYSISADIDPAVLAWLNGNQKKICVGVGGEAELLAIHEAATKQGVRCHLVLDHGLTEFGGVPTYTAVAIGPAAADLVDQITGSLGLL